MTHKENRVHCGSHSVEEFKRICDMKREERENDDVELHTCIVKEIFRCTAFVLS